jgi:predicted TIM-barrel fold metal-dependent hydrolase
MNRRRFLFGLGATGLLAAGGAAWRALPGQGVRNPCLAELPRRIADHELLQGAWEGLQPGRVWDCHVHLVGTGDSGSGIWVNPALDSFWHPIQYAQKLFYLNAGCVHEAPGQVDASYVERMHNLVDGMRPGVKLLLLALDYAYDDQGRLDRDATSFYTPNSYARDTARKHPYYFEWAASIHPYRADAVAALENSVREGAVAIKWLPNAMGIDPASPRCDAFYAAMVRHDLPLVCHAGEERAVSGGDKQGYGNPLRLRRALDHGVRVVAAHCASLGQDRDLDQGPDGPWLDSFALFERLMEDPRYEGRLYADISAMTQFDRAGALERILERSDWHARLLNGSDYPLPGVLPVYGAAVFADRGLLEAAAVPILNIVQNHNPLLFDFVLKRSLRKNDKRLASQIFETQPFFDRGSVAV